MTLSVKPCKFFSQLSKGKHTYFSAGNTYRSGNGINPTTTDQREYHSYLEVEIKVTKDIDPRKSPLLCVYQLQEALESGGEDVRVGVSLCLLYV